VKAGCLDEATLRAFLDAKLPDQARVDVERHVATCAACTDLLTLAAANLADGKPQLIPGSLHPGTRVDRYRILETVGRGGMGEVYAAYHPDLDRRIALKVVREEGPGTAERRARLLREAQAIARLSHPNVIAVHDAGTFAERVYVAMEFVDGQTIDAWLAAGPRSWRQILDVFLAAGRGLAAAHAAGIVHRDFKPQNVMIGRNGAVRVMDFGLARLAGGTTTATSPAESGVEPAAIAPESSNVTRAGTVMGTPAYMAPEQFRGEQVDARSDQFSFCVALYEALHGQRPFQGEHILSLSFSVTEGEIRVPTKTTNVPAWVRRPLLRGLRPNPAERHPSMDALIEAMEDDPAHKRRRRLGVAAMVSVILAILLVAWQTASRRRAATDAEIARHLEGAGRAMTEARTKAAEARAVRTRAFALFDQGDTRNGEALWRNIRALVPTIDAEYDRAERSLETASAIDASRERHRGALADLRYEHLRFAGDFRLANKVTLLEERLAAVDPDGARRKALTAPGALLLRTSPAASRIRLERYERDPVTGRRNARAVGPLASGESTTALAPGSYRLLIEGPGLAPVVFPFELQPGERLPVELSLPAASAVPTGFVFVPPGPFWYGDADEQWRTQFLNAVPIHRRRTDAYLVATVETTYGDWIAFLEDLPPDQRIRRGPAITASLRGAVSLRQTAAGWQLTLQPSARVYKATVHDRITYPSRNTRASQDWVRFPVGGISPDDVTPYLAWLRDTGRVPGARWCSELEWERAARGADDRLFPSGDELAAEDANFDLTYDRRDGAYGPDEVGSHPSSRSPFNVEDLAGNIMEMVASSETPGGMVLRGGGYYYTSGSARSANREPIPWSHRDVSVGFRVCATIAGK
jgi:formylglycine-generating enzyme required for sulfatase activity